jgi:vancomycin resistance protein YoaR
MKKPWLFVLIPVGAAAAICAIVAARFESKIAPNTFVGAVDVGNLTKPEAEEKLAKWWDGESHQEITFYMRNKMAGLRLPVFKIGVALDLDKSLANAPMTTVISSTLSSSQSQQHLPIDLKWASEPAKEIPAYIEKLEDRKTPARVYFTDGQFKRIPEESGNGLDSAALLHSLSTALEKQPLEVEIPVAPAPARVSAEELNKITDVVSTFTTKFPVRKKDRNVNIRIAAGKINGWVLMPGDTFSFNQVVGRRTIQDGYKTAPVFKNGKHDMGVGGGICQVSSTLYNASLFADLQIVQRHNHSMPVAYLPVGRDATVDYGSLDLDLKNNLSTPIALNSDYKAGTLTFRILGKKDPSLDIKIESSDSQTWSGPIKTVMDPKIPLGQKKVLEKGSSGRSIRTFRVVYRDGREVARESLGRSLYKGGERVIAVGTMPTFTAPAVGPVAPTQPGPQVPTPVRAH